MPRCASTSPQTLSLLTNFSGIRNSTLLVANPPNTFFYFHGFCSFIFGQVPLVLLLFGSLEQGGKRKTLAGISGSIAVGLVERVFEVDGFFGYLNNWILVWICHDGDWKVQALIIWFLIASYAHLWRKQYSKYWNMRRYIIEKNERDRFQAFFDRCWFNNLSSGVVNFCSLLVNLFPSLRLTLTCTI